MEIKVSVREFVEFLLRSGDIDNRKSGGGEEAMAEGARIHRMIQRRMGIEYRAEVKLLETFSFPGYDIVLEGRADGIIEAKEKTVVDEIKTTYRELSKITAPDPVHLAQAKCYAFLYARQKELSQIGVRMTYCNIDTEEIRYFHENLEYAGLEKWFYALLEQYRRWADFTCKWQQKRNESIEKLTFPFSYRRGQKKLVGYIYQTVCEGKKLYLEAPTGVGKTISAVYPSLKAIGEGKADKLFYLTAKTVTGTVARDTLCLLREKGLCFKSVTVTAKEKLCPLEECRCNPLDCPFAKGHYDRINDAVYDLLLHEDVFDRERIRDYALTHEVCPFEMCLDMSLFSDGIICDYNYLFDPRAYLRRFFMEGTKGPYLFLIDEAHNLVERARSMYSAELYKEDFLSMKETVKEYSPYLAKLMGKCNKELLLLKKECSGYRVLESHEGVAMAVNKLHTAIHNYLDDHEDSPVREELLAFYFELSRFLDTYDRMDDHYVTYTGYDEKDRFFIKEFCVDPSHEVKNRMDRGVAAILFSATFLPIQYYKGLLGGTKEDYEAYAQSAFSPERQLRLVGSEVTSRYKRRGEEEYTKIAAYIHHIISAKKGNYLVFFPSHLFLEEVHGIFTRLYGEEAGIRIAVQESHMQEAEREAFLDRFLHTEEVCFDGIINMDVLLEEDAGDESGAAQGDEAAPEKKMLQDAGTLPDCGTAQTTLVGFCVLGGIFSEGIDLKRDSLIGALIVGTGLPQVCPEREILKEYFEKNGKDGFDYAYKYPGMNKVLQAAGRVIRTAEDQGVVALLDERFLQNGYRRLFPAEWDKITPVTIENAAATAKAFWENQSFAGE